ncbi:mitochondrial GTPase 1 [Arctopsyche grandis]|uniref:mitochondrial GTPase 1 n=1 Tax=Arctopsyche grandis TaxID=121162 RepID=UPI00406D72F5
MAQVANSFRTVFELVDKNVLRWFPGHMDRGMKQMQQKLIQVDCIIEVHDARIPFSGRNPLFKPSLFAVKPHILVLNKVDLFDPGWKPKVTKTLRKDYDIENIIFTSCKNDRCKGVSQMLPLMQDLIKNSDRYHRNQLTEHNIMIIGIPNVGKSSLLNTLRNRHMNRPNLSNVGAVPGITRSVQTRLKICEDPPVYVFDTPGILTPNIPNVYEGLKMALCNILVDHLVGEDIIADYLLFWLNKNNNFKYVQYMGVNEPTDSITTLLTKCAVELNRYKIIKTYDGSKKMYPDFIFAAKYMLDGFRNGLFGPVMLDKDYYTIETPDVKIL